MKKIINCSEDVAREMCRGIAAAHPALGLDAKYKVLYQRDIRKDKVNLISGGGSGHEPAHAGFIGKGMLDAAVCGDVFASPSQIQVYQAIRRVAGEKGVLLIIKNYSGDMMNFKNAAALAEEDGIAVDYIKVDDDIAVQDSLYTVGRRGVAGTVFVHKITGAAAEKGYPLAQVKRIAQKAADSVKSIGFALTSCTVPAKGTPTFELGETEMEYGVGIHGEPGIERCELQGANELAARMTQSLCESLMISGGERVAVMVNGFGASPLMELYLLNAAVGRELAGRGVTIVRTLVGNYMTSIDMAGASLSVIKLDDELEELLDTPCETPALHINGKAGIAQPQSEDDEKQAQAEPKYRIETPAEYAAVADRFTTDNMKYLVDAMSEIIIENEVPFCELDSFAGDGDFGMSVAKGFRQVKREWTSLIQAKDIGAFLGECSMVIMEYCGGASGPIWGSAFRAAGKAAEGMTSLDVAGFAKLMQAAVAGVQKTGERSFGRGAGIGDKTLMDALIPCANAWTAYAKEGNSFAEGFRLGAAAAVSGAEKTKDIVARMGRAGTVGKRSIGYPDAGAHALGVIFTGLSEKLK
ncbi:MAG: dihydroxyacetone kinase subunit DhaK [Christensenella sp.]|nr:dihydroxyacetone kinase subunit DhaK [Christensenella sp.]